MKELIKGRSEDQQKAIKYFKEEGGCFKKTMPDAEYDALVKAKVDAISNHHFKWWFAINPKRVLLPARLKGGAACTYYRQPLERGS